MTVSLGQRVLGRTTAENVKNPSTGKVIIKAGELIEEEQVEALEQARVQEVRIRSALTCETRNGICAKCYGRDLARGTPVNLGKAVGVIAAQSIGEPGTQLTMRTFHVGGAAMSSFKQPFINVKHSGLLRLSEMRAVQTAEGQWVALTKNGVLSIIDEDGRELESHKLVLGAIIAKPDGAPVKKGEQVVTWDPYNMPIITEKAGKIEFRDMISGITFTKEVNQSTGNEETVVIERQETAARIVKGPAVAANEWQAAEWRPGHFPAFENAARLAAMRALPGSMDLSFRWLQWPILNEETRLVMAADPTQGRLMAQGYEAHGPATRPLDLTL